MLVILGALILIGCTLILYSCEKGTQETVLNQLEIRQGGVLHGELHRAIKNRPRDGKKCDCKACFGICGVVWVDDSSESYNIDILFNVAPGKARIYFPILASNSESEFGIDYDLALPLAIVPTGYNNGILKQGLYSYNSSVVNYTYNGSTKVSYGYVDVDYQLW